MSEDPLKSLERALASVTSDALDDAPFLELLRLHEQMGKAASPKDQLRFAQRARDADYMPENVGFHHVAWCAMRLTDEALAGTPWPEPFESIHQSIEAVKQEHGLEEDEDWLAGEGPEEYRRLEAEWSSAHDALVARTVADHGEGVMADLFLNHRDEFDRRYEEGRRVFRQDLPEG